MGLRARLVSVLGLVLIAALALPSVGGAQQAAPVIPNPDKRDMFQLNGLDSYRRFSLLKNFEIGREGDAGRGRLIDVS